MKLQILNYNNFHNINAMYQYKYKVKQNKEKEDQINVKNFFIKKLLNILSINFLKDVRIKVEK